MDEDTIEPRSQDHTAATYAPKLLPEERTIDWGAPADAIVRRVRAFAPAPGAVATFRGGRLKVLRAEPERIGGDVLAATPKRAEIRLSEDETPVIHGVGGDAVALLEVAPAGRRQMYGGRVGARRADPARRAADVSPSARQVALEVVRRVADEGAYSNRLLPSALARSGLDQRDRALATELAYGTLRHVPELDAAIGARAARPIDRMTPGARAALRLGAYQLLHMRIPAHAAVGETVGVVVPRERGFVNAILRRLAKEPPAPPAGGDDRAISLRTGMAPWAVKELRTLLEPDEVERAALAFGERAPLSLRVNTCRATVHQVIESFRQAGYSTGDRRRAPRVHPPPGRRPHVAPGMERGLVRRSGSGLRVRGRDALAAAGRAGARCLRRAGREGGFRRVPGRRAGPRRRR